MLLSILPFAIGHFYLKKGFGYIVIISLNIFLLGLLINNGTVLMTAGSLISAAFMFFRFKMAP